MEFNFSLSPQKYNKPLKGLLYTIYYNGTSI